jgi:hypothetical protein
MIIQENKEEMIDRYLMGRLSLWELADVEIEIKNNPAFADEVTFQRDIMIGVNESKRIEIKSDLQSLKPAGILIKLQVDKTAIARISVAASILLLVSFAIFYPQIKSIRDSQVIVSKMNLK